MRIGCPKELKDHEDRVGLTPISVGEIVAHGHDVMIEAGAGAGIAFSDEDYLKAGAQIIANVDDIFEQADMIVKVKEPLAPERAKLREGQILFTYLHLAPDLAQTQDLIKSKAICIAYETVTSPTSGLPLLTPMSEVAGRLAPQFGAQCLENNLGGRGVLLGGVPGVSPADVVILGGGIAGTHAATIAIGMGASVTVVDRSIEALRRLEAQFGAAVKTAYSTRDRIAELVNQADLVIGTVLIPGAETPKLVTKEMVKDMKAGSALVDVSIDQGGCFETSKATTHSQPTYIVDDVVHYCVANMPGCVARTSTFALNNATLPYTLTLADKGWEKALHDDPHFAQGLNVAHGDIIHPAVGKAHNLPFTGGESL